MNFAHQRGVSHRDLKPGNILIDREGSPHVVDFGLAKLLERAAGREAGPVTQTGEFQGTLAYASPEQVLGDPGLVDIRSDVYSLGVVLYECLTGRPPYPIAGSISDVVHDVAETEPERPSILRRLIDDEVDTIVLKCLAKQRERRYQSAGALSEDLERYVAGRPIDAKRDSTWYVITKTVRRHWLPVSAAAAFVVLLLAFAASTTIQRNQIAKERDAVASLLTASIIEQGRALAAAGNVRVAEELIWREFFQVMESSSSNPPAPGWDLHERVKKRMSHRQLKVGWRLGDSYVSQPSFAEQSSRLPAGR